MWNHSFRNSTGAAIDTIDEFCLSSKCGTNQPQLRLRRNRRFCLSRRLLGIGRSDDNFASRNWFMRQWWSICYQQRKVNDGIRIVFLNYILYYIDIYRDKFNARAIQYRQPDTPGEVAKLTERKPKSVLPSRLQDLRELCSFVSIQYCNSLFTPTTIWFRPLISKLQVSEWFSKLNGRGD